MTAASLTTAPPPKHILVCGHKIHLRLLQTLIWVGIGGFSAVLVASGIYYGVTQNVLKHAWDHLFTQAWWVNGDVRHLVGRGIPEGIVALPMIKWAASSWKKHYDDRPIPDWEIAVRLIAFLVAAMALAIFATWVVTFGWSEMIHHSLHVQYVTPTKRTQEYEAFAIGLIIGQATHWIWKPAARTIQLRVAEATVRVWRRTGKIPAWEEHPLTPPTMRERVAWMMRAGIHIRDVGNRALYVRWVLPAIGVVYFCLMGLGVYARYFA